MEDFADLLGEVAKDKGKAKPYAIMDELKIPHYKYIDSETNEVYFEYALIEDLPEKYSEEFRHWMTGQTMPVVGDELAVYAWDMERWLAWKLRRTNILVFD